MLQLGSRNDLTVVVNLQAQLLQELGHAQDSVENLAGFIGDLKYLVWWIRHGEVLVLGRGGEKKWKIALLLSWKFTAAETTATAFCLRSVLYERTESHNVRRFLEQYLFTSHLKGLRFAVVEYLVKRHFHWLTIDFFLRQRITFSFCTRSNCPPKSESF